MASFPAQREAGAPAFERLYRRHVRDVHRYAVAMVPNSADAEDVVQTTFLNAFRALEQGQRPQRPLSWLMAIAHNVCRQRFRQQACRPTEVPLSDDVAAPAAEDAVSAEDIRRALSQLGFNQRTALVMRELEGRTYTEIAERLELSHGAVETLLFRARRALREQLEVLTCREAGLAIARQLDGVLPRHERGSLRAHLRSCSECTALARRIRGQRSAIKTLGMWPLPASLATFSASGSGVVAGIGARAVLLKVAGAATAMLVAGGGGYEAVRTLSPSHPRPRPASTPTPAVVPEARTTAALPVRLPAAISRHVHAHSKPAAQVRIPAPRTVSTGSSSAAVAPAYDVGRRPNGAHGASRQTPEGTDSGRPQPSQSHDRPAEPGNGSGTAASTPAASRPEPGQASSCTETHAADLPVCPSQTAAVVTTPVPPDRQPVPPPVPVGK
jgi:RNA polymerase sigma factor (sigma-70 family)